MSLQKLAQRRDKPRFGTAGPTSDLEISLAKIAQAILTPDRLTALTEHFHLYASVQRSLTPRRSPRVRRHAINACFATLLRLAPAAGTGSYFDYPNQDVIGRLTGP